MYYMNMYVYGYVQVHVYVYVYVYVHDVIHRLEVQIPPLSQLGKRTKEILYGVVKKEVQKIHSHMPQREKEDCNEDEGQGAAILSFKSQVKLMPDDLSSITSDGIARNRQPGKDSVMF